MSPGLLNKEGPPRRSSGTVPPLPQLLVAEPSPAPPWWPCPGGAQLRGLPLLSFFSLSACCPPHPASRKPESVSNKSPQLHRAGSGCCWPWAVPCCLPSPFQAGKRPRPPSLLVPPRVLFTPAPCSQRCVCLRPGGGPGQILPTSSDPGAPACEQLLLTCGSASLSPSGEWEDVCSLPELAHRTPLSSWAPWQRDACHLPL